MNHKHRNNTYASKRECDGPVSLNRQLNDYGPQIKHRPCYVSILSFKILTLITTTLLVNNIANLKVSSLLYKDFQSTTFNFPARAVAESIIFIYRNITTEMETLLLPRNCHFVNSNNVDVLLCFKLPRPVRNSILDSALALYSLLCRWPCWPR